MSESREEQKQRHAQAFRADEAQNAARRTKFYNQCPHIYSTGDPAIGLQHNFPDRVVRGICLRCGLFIQPRHWEIAPPTDHNTPGRAVRVDAHPLYPIVLMVDGADVGRAILNDVADAAIDSLMRCGENRWTEDLGHIIHQAHWEIQEGLRREVKDWLAVKETK